MPIARALGFCRTQQLRMSRWPVCSLALTFAAAISGCAGPLNNELIVGDPLTPSRQFAPPTIMPGSNTPARPESGDDLEQPASPSIAGLDRSHWPETRVVVPNDPPMHQPRYTDNWHFNRTNARARGDYPTARSALDSSTSAGADQQIKEAVAAPFVAGLDIAAMPVRMIAARPWQRTRTGSEPYARGPSSRVIVPEGLTPVDDDTPGVAPKQSPVREMAPPNSKPRPSPHSPEDSALPGESLFWPTSPDAAAPGLVPAPVSPLTPAPKPRSKPGAAPATKPDDDQPLWNRPPVATDERGKHLPPPPPKNKPADPDAPESKK